MERVPFSLHRTLLIADATLREAVRLRLLSLLVLLALGWVVGVQYLGEFSFASSELKFVADLGEGAIAVFGALLTIVGTAQLFLGEIEHRTALTLLAKAVRRREFVVGKYLGLVGVSGAFCAIMGGTLGLVLWARGSALSIETPGGSLAIQGGWLGLVTACWSQWMKLLMLGAGTLLVACFAQTQIYTVVVGFGIWVVCHLQNLVRPGSAAWQPSRRLIGSVFPDFQLFSMGMDAGTTWPELVRLTGYAGGHVVVTCALAAFVFSKREL